MKIEVLTIEYIDMNNHIIFSQKQCSSLKNEIVVGLKNKKQKIPPNLKLQVWDKWIGIDKGKTKCLCCNYRDIYQASFSCGHVIAESRGGKLELNNLKPICGSCNSSMGVMNMGEYAEKFFG